MGKIISRNDEIVLDTVTGKYKKTSVISSELSAEELRNYLIDLKHRAAIIDIERDSIRSEIKQIEKLVGE